jgi:hypothetical protein
MASVIRLLIGAGLFALGYYVGREIGRLESIREEMRRLREAQQAGSGASPAPTEPQGT